ncbi:class III lanthionine synthetase LanKC [Polymorphospora rubra]|uniref:non-specific serine/threonine protein kinase n=1 Tax=Polymorphospora rubra TaxID=338584 RepID=A0A810N6S0_9ACTN|nr:class III lanthionine synthetase LanKC [Polymorphospora rubra]BCJ68977.1 serine/threonine protein kinase [Polymorphospora rubra]
MDIRYLEYCHEGEPFFDRPAYHSTGTDFPLVADDLPTGWTRDRDGEWVFLAPGAAHLPDQGWKVHVSATLENAPEILDECWAYCRRVGTPFKFIRGLDHLKRRNSKYGDRSASGKFVTIYPRDEAALGHVLHELGTALDGRQSPYILSDLRWRTGPLYVRYGGFRMIEGRGPHGEPVPCIVDPDGNLVPDVRRPGFHPPAWVPVPAILGEAVAARASGTLKDFPYRASRALHYSNGGGVYQGTDTRTGATVLLKEARPLAGLDRDGRDAVARLRQEHWALERLAGLDCVPEALDFRTGNEHLFLVRRFVDGTPLSRVVSERNPLITGDGDVAGYTAWALSLLDRIERALREMHGRGVLFNDLHPNNILVTPDGEVTFIDFETAGPVADAAAQAIGAPGFCAPPGCVGVDADRYALACVALATFLPLTIVTMWGPEKTRQLLDLVAADFPVPGTFLERLRRDLRLDTGEPSTGGPADPLWPDPDPDSLDEVRTVLGNGVLATADPGRPDRLYPGDIGQFLSPVGGWGFAYGAAGTLWALSRAGVKVPAEHEERLRRVVREVTAGPDFGAGLSGMAYALDRIGLAEQAGETLERAMAAPRDGLDAGLLAGLSGLGLTLLHFAGPGTRRHLVGAADRVAGQLADFTDRYAPRRPGLLHGPAGHALFLLRLHEHSGDPTLLDRAAEALGRDVAMFGFETDAAPWRHLHGLAGPVGTAMVIAEFLRHRDDAGLRRAAEAFRVRARARFMPGAGWFSGRAGSLLGLHYLAAGLDPAGLDPAGRADDRAAVRRHLTDLGWHAVRRDDGRAFLGEHGLKLSPDLATGASGVLLAVHTAVTDAPTPVPFFPQPSPAGVRS